LLGDSKYASPFVELRVPRQTLRQLSEFGETGWCHLLCGIILQLI
jgi:hypothetical protein